MQRIGYKIGLIGGFIGGLAACGPPELQFGDPKQSNTPTSKPLVATYESISENIILKKCIGCHSGGGNAARIPLTTLEEILNSPLELVIPGNPEESGLMIAVTRDDDKRMPPKRLGPGLSEEEIKTIEEWIVKGGTL